MDVEAASSAADVVQTSREAHSNTFFRSRRAAPNSAEPREHGTVPKAARSPDPSSHTKDIFEYFNHRKEQDGKNCCVLVAWKSGRYTFIVDVPVSDPNDEQQIYTDSRQEYYKRRGCWRKHLLFRDVEMVQWASVRIGGLVDQRTLVGRAQVQDIPELLKDCNKKIEALRGMTNPEYGCRFDPVTHKWDHKVGFHPKSIATCPAQKLDSLERFETFLHGFWFMTQCFHDPLLAAQQKLLKSNHRVNFIHEYDNFNLTDESILRLRHDTLQLRDIAFDALLISEAFDKGRVVDAGLVVSIMTVVLTVIVRMLGGDWNTAFAGGSLFVGWASLVLVLLQYYSIRR